MRVRNLLVLCVFVPWWSVGWASHEVGMTEQQMLGLGLTLVPVERTQWVVIDRLPARVVIPPQQERVVSAPSGGLVTELRVGVGDSVTRGQELATLESPSLISLQRDYLQAGTRLRLAQADLARDRKLFKDGIIAELGYLPMARQGIYNLFQLFTGLYEYRSVILTTNKDFTSWGEFFRDDNVAVPIVDRLIHHSHVFMLGGESYRLKQKLGN